jgi:hypothetical protein
MKLSNSLHAGVSPSSGTQELFDSEIGRPHKYPGLRDEAKHSAFCPELNEPQPSVPKDIILLTQITL